MPNQGTHIIFPVILKVSPANRNLAGRDQAAYLQEYARQAVAASARHSGVELPPLKKDSKGVPIAEKGIYWSLSHKPEYVAGVVAKTPTGIDIEKIRPVRAGLFNKITDERERGLAPLSDGLFYRFWTAKEAVLKATGLGLAGLSRCRITHIFDAESLDVVCEGTHWRVAHRVYDHHLISIIINDNKIDWNLPS